MYWETSKQNAFNFNYLMAKVKYSTGDVQQFIFQYLSVERIALAVKDCIGTVLNLNNQDSTLLV